jgi:hypothetical protein
MIYLLRIALALQCAGAARLALGEGIVADLTATAFLIGITVALFAPVRTMLVALAVLFAGDAIAATLHAGGELSVFGRAVRYVAPAAMILWSSGQGDRARRFLALGIAAVFASHGLEAIAAKPQFVDYLVVTVGEVAGAHMTPAAATAVLLAIGLADVVLAILAVARPSRKVLGYMAFWGFATALMRVVYFGWDAGYGHALVRAMNGAAPLFLLVTSAPRMLVAVSAERSDRWLEQT